MTETHTITIPVPVAQTTVTRTWTRQQYPTGHGPWSTTVDGARWVVYSTGLTDRIPTQLKWTLATSGQEEQTFTASDDAQALSEATWRLDVRPMVANVQARLAAERVAAAEREGDARALFQALGSAIQTAPAELAARRAHLVETLAREHGSDVKAAEILGVTKGRIGHLRKDYREKYRPQVGPEHVRELAETVAPPGSEVRGDERYYVIVRDTDDQIEVMVANAAHQRGANVLYTALQLMGYCGDVAPADLTDDEVEAIVEDINAGRVTP